MVRSVARRRIRAVATREGSGARRGGEVTYFSTQVRVGTGRSWRRREVMTWLVISITECIPERAQSLRTPELLVMKQVVAIMLRCS